MSKEKLIDLDRDQLDLLHTILQRHIRDKTVWAYGSRATWKATETSDLDLVVFDCDPMQIYDLKEALEESDLLISVDVMDWESIPDDFKENIRGKYVVLQDKPSQPVGWREVKLGDVAGVIGGGTPNTSVDEYWNGDIPWLTPKDLSTLSGCYVSKGERSISELGLSKSSAKLLPKGTVLLSTRAPVGYLAIAKCEVSTNQGFRSLIPNEKTDSSFLFYLLKQNVPYLQSQSEGTTFGELAGSTLKSLSFLFPPLNEQKAIAEVLSSLDDKIDLLHRQNKTLEDMAQTLFRKWFVNEKDDSWKHGKLEDVFTVKGGTTPSTKEKAYWNGEINWTTPRDLSNHNSIFLLDTEKRITQQGLAKISSGLLPVGTVLLSSRAPVGYLTITDINLAVNQGYIAIMCDKILSNYFVYLWCKQNIEIIKNASGGTVFQEIPKAVFRQIDIAIPPEKLLSSFDQLIKPTFQKVKYNQHQIRKLENLRNTLLPQLMKGDVRV